MILARKLFACFVAVCLAGSLVPFSSASAYAAPESADGANDFAAYAAPAWYEDIDALLQAGDYAEGEVIVMVRAQAQVEAQAEASGYARGRSLDWLSLAQPLASVSEEAAVLAWGDDALAVVADGGESPAAAFGLRSGEAANGAAVEGAAAEGAAAAGEGAAAAGDDAHENAGGGELSLVLLRDETLTTKEMLYALADDPRVVAAQPNYVHSVEDATRSDTSSPASSRAYADEMAAYESLEDFTSLQWAYDSADEASGGPVMVTPGAANTPGTTAAADINPTSWNAAGATNAKGVIAVLDTGVDYTHPDLDGIMVDLSAYTGLAGGKHGFNAANPTNQTDPMDEHGHGTHVAGIIAAEWDGRGTSGAASGVQLAAVRIARSGGNIYESDALRGLQYVVDMVDAGVPVVAANNSWGGSDASYAIATMVNELGEKGVVSVFASGNDSKSLDNNPDTSAMLRTSPYAVVVNGSTNAGTLGWFTNWGSVSTDVFAPGLTILAPTIASDTYYLAELDPAPAFFESFDASALGGVKVSVANGEGSSLAARLTQVELTQTGSRGVPIRFDDQGGALELKLDDVPVQEEGNRYHASFRLSLRFESEEALKNAKYMSFQVLSSKGSMVVEPSVNGVKNGSQEKVSLSGGYAYNDEWMAISFNLEDALRAAGCDSLACEIAIDGSATMDLVLSVTGKYADTSLYVDALGAGGAIAPYVYADGTSTAAPAVTGAAAVLAAEKQGWDGRAPRTGADAAALAALVKSSVSNPLANADDDGDPANDADNFVGVCTSNGQVDLSVDDEARTPVVTSAAVGVSEGRDVIKVTGGFFGGVQGSGLVFVGGKAAEVTSWSADAITVEIPAGLASGVIPVEVKADNGKAGAKSFLLEIPANGGQGGEQGGEGVQGGQGALPLFEKQIDLSAHDGLQISSHRNVLVGVGGKLYIVTRGAEGGAYEGLYCYDPATDAVSACAWMDPAVRINNVSATAYKGKLLVFGEVDLADGSNEMALYCYDPQKGEWASILLPDGVPHLSSLVNCGGDLLLFGGADSERLSARAEDAVLAQDNIRLLDLEAGAVTPVGSLLTPRMGVSLSVSGATVYASAGYDADLENSYKLEAYTWADGRVSGESLTGLLPAAADDTYYPRDYAVAATADGVLVAGYDAVGGSSSGAGGNLLANDIFLMRNGEADDAGAGSSSGNASATFEGFGKRALHETLLWPSAYAYDGWLYVMASSPYQEGGLTLRATRVDTLPVAGDGEYDPDWPGSGDLSGSGDGPASGSGDGSASGSGTGDGAPEGNGTTSSALPGSDTPTLAGTGDGAPEGNGTTSSALPGSDTPTLAGTGDATPAAVLALATTALLAFALALAAPLLLPRVLRKSSLASYVDSSR